jgi:CRISPR-associated protein Cmr1
MKSVTFNCEVITPMFLAGADGHTPELRPPSIKGAMRFWWRAMKGDLPLDKLRKEESRIFGASDENIGRSKFSVRVRNQQNEKIVENLWREIPNEEKESRRGKKYKTPLEYKGISYLLYSTHRLDERPYFGSGTLFSVSILSSDYEILKGAVHSLVFLTFLGGLGTRSRRGAGAFVVNSVILDGDDDYEELAELFQTSETKTKEQLKDGIESKLKPLLANTSNRRYSILKNSKVYILDPKNNWKDALEDIGYPFFCFRNRNRRRIECTPNFGFPIHHKNPRISMGAGQKNYSKNKSRDEIGFWERRASPLVFKVIRTNGDTYFPVIIWLNGEFIPSDYRIMDKEGGHEKAASEKIIEDFLETMENKVEVVL